MQELLFTGYVVEQRLVGLVDPLRMQVKLYFMASFANKADDFG